MFCKYGVVFSCDIVLCLDDTVLCLDDIVLCFDHTMLCFDDIVLCFDNSVLCFDNYSQLGATRLVGCLLKAELRISDFIGSLDTGALSFCSEKPVFPVINQMERTFPPEIFRKKRNTF